MKKDSSIDYFR